MTFPPLGRRAGDEGQASLFLILGLMFSLVAVMTLFIRLGNANDMRSQAQTTADAAALAAVNSMQQRLAESIAAGGISHFGQWDPETGEAAAREYARENGGVVEDIRASDDYTGTVGDHVRVVVRGAQCQRELEKDRGRHWAEVECDGTEKKKKIDTFSGEAAAVARIDAPNCSLKTFLDYKDDPYYLPICNGKVITTVEQALDEINVQLTDDEGQYIFDPASAFGGDLSGLAGGNMGPCDAPGADNTTPLMCETHKAILKQFTIPFGSGCYRADGGIVVGEHPKGRACDYMMANGGSMPSAQNQAVGQALADWLQANAGKLGVMYIIWRQQIWSPSRAGEGWRDMSDRGSITQNHYDHVHLSVN